MKVNFHNKFSKFTELWSPKVIAEMNDYQFKLVKIQGEFIWHTHQDTDEVFIVIEGTMNIQFSSETIELNQGELFVVPKGVKHKPYSENECKIMIVEPRGVVNTGDCDSGLKAENNVWV